MNIETIKKLSLEAYELARAHGYDHRTARHLMLKVQAFLMTVK